MNRNQEYQYAVYDFQSAHLRAKLQGVLARVTGRSNELLSYEDIASKLKLQGRSDKGIQTIPVNAIIGSVGRYTDFTRTFLPRRSSDKERWVGVKAGTLGLAGAGFPPIEVYKVSEVYFVLDGNHRVSIARQEGWELIQAHIIEIQTDVPLTPDIQPDELIAQAEYVDFLEQTGFNRSRLQVDLRMTTPGGYQKLLDEVCVCRCQIEEEGHAVCSLQDSAESWYREIYLPFAEAVRERGMLRWFPNRTITDLYVWMSAHRAELENELGWTIRPEAAADVVIQSKSRRATAEESKVGSWRKARLLNRYSEHLFRDILVPISHASERWDALEQALLIAQREDAHIHGLHTVSAKANVNSPHAIKLQDQFNQLCEQSHVQGSLAFEAGEPTQKILERSTLTDLIVMKVSYPPSAGIKVLASGIHTLITRSSRPILAIPDQVSKIDHALVAFDGSPKAREALFVAAYFAEQWKTQLTIFTGLDGNESHGSLQDFAQNYLEFNEIEADFVSTPFSPGTLITTAEETHADIILMGGYSGSILKEMTVGSSVNSLLRESQIPILICR